MIRINLLSAERERTKTSKKKKASIALGTAAQKQAVTAALILALGVGFVGWRYLTVTHDSAQLDTDIAKAKEETARLRTIIQQVQQFEQRKAQLQQRVQLIEQLRKSQGGPVHMLDQISRSLPQMMWLTELKQTADAIEITGKCTALTSLSEYVNSLEGSGYFQRSIEIVSTQTEALQAPPGELIRFTIKAVFQVPNAPAAAAASGAAKKSG
jgi:type IV pilus assembly protein PilN